MALSKIPSAGFQDNVKFRNILINGSLDISQRSTSTSSITSTDYHTVDRWQTNISSMGTWTQSQSTTVPSGQGFAKSLKMDCTTADASPSASDQVVIEQKVEGQNLQYLNFGNSSAKSLTLSFWVRSNKTGTYCASLFNNDQSKWFSKQYTISSADTWEKKTLTYAGDTSNAFNNDSGTSLRCRFWLGAGSTYTSGTITSTWTTESGNEGSLASGQVNLADSTSNEWYITGIQLETGSQASDFEFLPFDVNLQRCFRYCYVIGDTPNGLDFSKQGIVGHYYSSTSFALEWFYQVPMRASPSFTVSSTSLGTVYSNGAGRSVTNVSANSISPTCWGPSLTTSSATSGDAGHFDFGSQNAIIDAEL
jgi:hypothetical protein